MRFLKELLPPALVATFVLGCPLGCTKYAQESKTGETALGAVDTQSMDPAYFSLPDSNGRSVEMTGFRGKPVLLNFWASWCQPCIDELPALMQFADWAKREAGVETVAVSVDESWAPVKKVLSQKKFWPGAALPLTILLNADGGVSAAFGCTKYPESYFIDRNYKIIRKFIGVQEWTSQEIKKWVTEHSKQ
ncbi:MAG: TlpA family protein disulfide reductase [Deltaproteobacteria bacterium]|nr:TlpA family protein disulfide reductase [Deltaproteobacteria bacterium]